MERTRRRACAAQRQRQRDAPQHSPGAVERASSLAQLRDAAAGAGVGDTAVLLPDLRDTAAVLQAIGL